MEKFPKMEKVFPAFALDEFEHLSAELAVPVPGDGLCTVGSAYVAQFFPG